MKDIQNTIPQVHSTLRKGTLDHRQRMATAILLIMEVVLFVTAFGVLSRAIDWPASLDEPAAVVLPQLVAHQSAVLFGYSSYFLASVLLVPLAIALHCLFSQPGSRQQSPLLLSATAFGVLSGAMKVLGLLRWLFVMPYLADRYVAAGQSPETQATILLLYDAVNLYAGKIGEFIGLQLLTTLWIGLLSIALLRSRQVPKWLCGFGLVVATVWASSFLADFDIGLFESAIFIGTTLLNVWYISLAIWLLKGRPRRTH